MSAAADLSSSVVCPDLSVYCSGSTDNQLEIKMKTKMVTASGSTNGAMRMPMALSLWLRICSVMASQNSCTPLGTSLEVILARRKNASASTITAAIPVDRMVSVLTVIPSHVAWWCSPTSIADSARIASIIAGLTSFRLPGCGAVQIRRFVLGSRRSRRLAAPELLPYRQCGREHQQHLEECQPEHHAEPGGAEQVGNDQRDDGDDRQPGR